MEQVNRTEFSRVLLDCYFLNRESRNLYDGSIQENKTTVQIKDELAPMLDVSEEDIVDYMLEHGYGLTMEEDGTVVWEIWRMWED